MSRTFKLGTRRSLLAWAQSGWVAREVERLNPGVRVELVGIETRGDRILDVSLREVEGKEFFVAELDEALRGGQVDFTVHSMKDLSLMRPGEFVLAAIPRRENCRDVVLFGPGSLERLNRGETLKIGTSSPRRIENIPSFLEKALPRPGHGPSHRPRLEFVEIRGNVNTRLGRVHEPPESPRHLDAVVLAFAGLIRLWADPAGRTELRKLLQGIRWMVLPLRECPTAPAQGALAVECRSSDEEMRAILAKLHDPRTAELVGRERSILSDWGGGCHQKFGATAIPSEALGNLLFIRGKKPDETFVEEVRWNAPSPPAAPVRAWDGSEWKPDIDQERTEPLPRNTADRFGSAVFIAHSRAVAPERPGEWPNEWISALSRSRVWTAGTTSWFKLAELGIWVEGCAEGLGFEFLTQTLQEDVLQLPALDTPRLPPNHDTTHENWTVLTHAEGLQGWKRWRNLQARATYRLLPSGADRASAQSPAVRALAEATHVFWSSGSQFDSMRAYFPKNAHHACGAGKTAAHLRSQAPDLALTVFPSAIFPSVKEWKKWLKSGK